MVLFQACANTSDVVSTSNIKDGFINELISWQSRREIVCGKFRVLHSLVAFSSIKLNGMGSCFIVPCLMSDLFRMHINKVRCLFSYMHAIDSLSFILVRSPVWQSGFLDSFISRSIIMATRYAASALKEKLQN
ncbi:hypothetical protein VNO77_34217 [Canavalia gladiata]|uniref:Uncharacterized protein n=1 Tax=Canavalia gladiata TaxID=3824 RepID=A0AAN9PYC7_CANGL